MITQYEVKSIMAHEIPQLDLQGYPANISLEIYTSISKFIDYTRYALESHSYGQAKRCFEVAEHLYLNGDKVVRHLIENNFLYAFSSNDSYNRTDNLIMKCIIPKALYMVYIKQLQQKDRSEY